MFFEILCVTLLVEGLLRHREKKSTLRKLHPTISLFMFEFGSELLTIIARMDRSCSLMAVKKGFTPKQFKAARVQASTARIELNRNQLNQMRRLLAEHSHQIEAPLRNPNMTEHEEFTDMLLALHHLKEELKAKASFSDEELAVVSQHCSRVYRMLAEQWVLHLRHIQTEYPYMFDYAIRTSPFKTSHICLPHSDTDMDLHQRVVERRMVSGSLAHIQRERERVAAWERLGERKAEELRWHPNSMWASDVVTPTLHGDAEPSVSSTSVVEAIDTIGYSDVDTFNSV
ncbi:hypothetical protein KIPB_004579 [Kipferlia bialata]|nr:hypothetical protein KIPB_004579 [Kipferlia bialata]|eukprot:g4579.t1